MNYKLYTLQFPRSCHVFCGKQMPTCFSGIVFIDFLPVKSREKQRKTYVLIFNYTHSHNPLRNVSGCARECVQVIIIKSTQLVQFHCELVNVLWSFRVRVYRPRLQVANVNSLKSEEQHSQVLADTWSCTRMLHIYSTCQTYLRCYSAAGQRTLWVMNI